jgi:glycerol uptake facilitator-like aquaporin
MSYPLVLGLTLIHLISIPITNTSVSPARSTGVALYVGGWAIGQPRRHCEPSSTGVQLTLRL